MLRSLVGSEMCIRDSLCAARGISDRCMTAGRLDELKQPPQLFTHQLPNESRMGPAGSRLNTPYLKTRALCPTNVCRRTIISAARKRRISMLGADVRTPSGSGAQYETRTIEISKQIPMIKVDKNAVEMAGTEAEMGEEKMYKLREGQCLAAQEASAAMIFQAITAQSPRRNPLSREMNFTRIM
eukprot:TRINITY_DN7142_c0_g1_i4.p1 TRINITY_DN7142_c0_g1~~TRINITY_DN7142_c0_g1_i4.p1  ORF type:complete len:184 (-),score=55.43 TRINITY_DN7142_c0_g1_i4:415-966(-)